jgi:YhcH/YjgK/YiaL family protein
MIFGTISKSSDEIRFLPQPLQEALAFLKASASELSKLEAKKYPVKEHDLGDFFMLVQEYQTNLRSMKKAEQHKNFIDIHYLVSGKEAIGFGTEDPKNIVFEKYSEEKDCVLYTHVNDETFINLLPGQFAICFPSDIHRPGCAPKGEKAMDAKKVVIKVAMKLLQ